MFLVLRAFLVLRIFLLLQHPGLFLHSGSIFSDISVDINNAHILKALSRMHNYFPEVDFCYFTFHVADFSQTSGNSRGLSKLIENSET